jgi:hypothetical protein
MMLAFGLGSLALAAGGGSARRCSQPGAQASSKTSGPGANAARGMARR